jgi:hypothetical protein
VGEIMQWLTSPILFFRNLNANPRWIPAFIIVTMLSLAANIASFPITKQLALKQAAASGISSANDVVIHSLNTSLMIGLVAAPIRVAILWAFWSGIIYGILSLGSSALTYRQILAIYGFSTILPTLDNLLGILLNYIVGMDFINTPEQFNSSLASLASLIPRNANQFVITTAKDVNLGAVLFVAWLTLGITYTPKGRLGTAFAIAMGVLLLKVGISLGVTILLRSFVT